MYLFLNKIKLFLHCALSIKRRRFTNLWSSETCVADSLVHVDEWVERGWKIYRLEGLKDEVRP